MSYKRDFVKILKALSDNIRLKILQILLEEGEQCVDDLIKRCPTTQSNISFHLQVLKKAKLVTNKREGKRNFYSLNWKELTLIVEWLQKILTPPSLHSSRAKSSSPKPQTLN